jgi:pimeloyl-ACP methyl ester carboxylesterase
MNSNFDDFKDIEYENIAPYIIGVRRNRYVSQRKTVLLIHGIGVSSAYFVPLANELSENYNVFALDLPGYGKAPKPKQPLTINELSDIVYAFIQTHSLQDVTVVGHSMGCQIIALLHDNRENTVFKKILLSPTVNRKERMVVLQSLRLFQDTFLESPKANITIFSDYLRMGVIRFLKTSRFMVEDLIESSLHDTEIPTLIVRGENDVIVPRDWTKYLQTLSDKISIKEVRSAPHAFHFRYPAETAEICKVYIES